MLLGVCRPGNARTDRAAPIAGRPALNGSTTEAQEDERFEVTERIAIFRPRRKSAADMLLEQYTAFGDRTQVIADGSRKAPNNRAISCWANHTLPSASWASIFRLPMGSSVILIYSQFSMFHNFC